MTCDGFWEQASMNTMCEVLRVHFFNKNQTPAENIKMRHKVTSTQHSSENTEASFYESFLNRTSSMFFSILLCVFVLANKIVMDSNDNLSIILMDLRRFKSDKPSVVGPEFATMYTIPSTTFAPKSDEKLKKLSQLDNKPIESPWALDDLYEYIGIKENEKSLLGLKTHNEAQQEDSVKSPYQSLIKSLIISDVKKV